MSESIRIEKRGYQLEYRSDGVFLTVLPETQTGVVVTVDDVIVFLERKQITGFDMESVKKVVESRDGTAQKIAEAQEEHKIDADIQVKVSDNKMKASIYIIPPEGGSMLSGEQMMAILKEEGVMFGIDTDTIETLSKYPVYNQDVQIAKGVEPVNGENGKMQYHFQLSKSRTPKILEDGRVDFHELDLIENVHAGDVLVTAIPPTPGVPGKNVYDEEIPPIPGKPVVLPKGKNVEVSEDGLKLTAAIDGQVVIADYKVNVYALYEVNGDVDNSVGNIDFVGNVVIKGNVLTGFSIKAGGTVEVQGVVEGATIIATGDIVLRRGMQGLNRGILVTDGNIVAKYIEHSHLTAKGDIKSEAIMHSIVNCGGTLELAGKKGLIVGGTAKVGREIIAKVIGSPMATATELEVGLDPNVRERYKELKMEITRMESEITKADQAVQLLKKLESVNKLDEHKASLMAKSVKTKVFLSNKLKEMKKEFELLGKRLEEEENGKIKVMNVIYPGTKVTIGSSIMYIKENMSYCTLYRDGVDIRIGTYER